MKKYFVYAYYRSVADYPDRPFYVGKGSGKRHEHHLLALGDGPKDRCVRKHRDTLVIRKLVEHVDEAYALHVEEVLIAFFGRRDKGTGILFNATDGGDGPKGMIRTREHCKKIGDANRRRVISAVTRARISASNVGKHHKPQSEENRKKKSLARLAYFERMRKEVA